MECRRWPPITSAGGVSRMMMDRLWSLTFVLVGTGRLTFWPGSRTSNDNHIGAEDLENDCGCKTRNDSGP